MTISDKALGLIGRKILGRMDNTTHQDEIKPNPKQATAVLPSHPELKLQSIPKLQRAPVLRFPARDDDT
jgi:hypothetical protein